ncbi:hypothetical protein [Cobetia sp. Ld8]|uniref:capsular polysaccharide export protein, LipB/KpsS family n=1 Tax=Cobetia sp. Ld8 TaxID=649154 RepID=UPI00386F5552
MKNASKIISKVDESLQGLFFKKKPKEFSYDYITHNPYALFKEPKGFKNFYLVGRNWVTTQLPIVVVVGCNDWKLGFLADYLDDYRVAFLPRKSTGVGAVMSMLSLQAMPHAILVWGYTESYWVRHYAKLKCLPIWRVEDGFLRSSSLGASHSTPYSLVFDTEGLYYNSRKPSSLEAILSEHDFSSDDELMVHAKECLNVFKNLSLSKYNPPLAKKLYKNKTRKRIAVLGQVDADASIKYGNPDNWTSEELVKLAYSENPECEIFYRPHPEVFKGYQKSSLKKKKIEKICQISSPEIDIVDFLDSVDHVYTITSLTGFEALLYGRKVTVVGLPFYAGWGVTDDRVETPRRKRLLSTLEIFAGAYLLYPKYLADKKCTYKAFLASCYRIKADQYISMDRMVRKGVEDNEQFREASQSYKWPAALVSESHTTSTLDVLRLVDFSSILGDKFDRRSATVICAYVIGRLEDPEHKDAFLGMVRTQLSSSAFNDILIALYTSESDKSYLVKHWAWLFNVTDDISCEENVDILRRLLPIECEVNSNIDITDDVKLVLSQNMLDRRQFSEFFDISLGLLVSGVSPNQVLISIIEGCELSFDFTSKYDLAKFLQGINLLEANRAGVFHEFSTFRFVTVSTDCFLLTASRVLALKPELTSLVKIYAEAFLDQGKEKWWPILEAQLALDASVTVRKVRAYIELERFEKALELSKVLVEQSAPSDGVSLVYVQSLACCGLLDDAEKVAERLVSQAFNLKTVSELLKVYTLKGAYCKAKLLLEEALSSGISIGDMHKRKVYFGVRELAKAFHAFTEMPVVEKLKTYYPDKYYDFSSPLKWDSSLLLLAVFGPGDEIRFASVYSRFTSLFGVQEILVTCSPKLTALMKRSFPELSFVEVDRIRSTDDIELSDYSEVPGSDVMGFVNNAAVQEIDKCESLLFVTDSLHHLLPDYNSFNREAYLVANDEKVGQYKKRLPEDVVLIGLSWRSGLSTSARNLHYLTIEQLLPLFELEGVLFVNFQYDDCEHEISIVESLYPGKLVDFSDIDHYNDFDSVAALMKCMDLIISPATTVAELAGAVGCETFLFSNSTELDWRKRDEEGRDVWYDKTRIIDVAQKGDKEILVEEIKNRVIEFLSVSERKSKLNLQVS